MYLDWTLPQGQFYTCVLFIFNPDGLDNFKEITGDHLPNRGNDDVEIVYAAFGTSPNIPQIICNQFSNITEMEFVFMRTVTVEGDPFAGCNQLKNLLLPGNRYDS
jgi:hypothetical protein